MEPQAAAKKSFKLVWRCHQLLSAFLTKAHLPRMSHQSPNDKVIITCYRGLCTDLLAFTLQLRKTSPRRQSMMAVTNDALNGVPCLHMSSVGLHNTS